MDTMDFNFGRHEADGETISPSPRTFRCGRRFTKEPDGDFRNSVRAYAFNAEYAGKGTRSEFIENVRLG